MGPYEHLFVIAVYSLILYMFSHFFIKNCNTAYFQHALVTPCMVLWLSMPDPLFLNRLKKKKSHIFVIMIVVCKSHKLVSCEKKKSNQPANECSCFKSADHHYWGALRWGTSSVAHKNLKRKSDTEFISHVKYKKISYKTLTLLTIFLKLNLHWIW